MTDGEGPDPHADQPVVSAGAPAAAADAVVLALHGRGATAQGVVNLVEPLYRHGVAVVAPQASRSRWFPHGAGEPVERNEPHVSSALAAVDRTLAEIREWGVPPERVLLFGFSQGACVASEYVARNPQRFGGVAALRGGLLGPVGETRDFAGALDGTPVFLGVGGDDERVDAERIAETAAVFRELGGDVTERVADGVGHAVADDEFEAVGGMLDALLDGEV
ncbi:alpha/beta hydrolase [Halobacterium litoreum]|uniref:Alpha/beta hydrolase n=1 Tax=Halobacterium litoreum TaxID=2039234 RepID=A0ABD5NHR8_9EURY|nr:alpha/beta hydrolase [Halobacterium litoreum]UHH12446.1 dienelactone hydrolase family protein [Halobacterium litoreum]